MIWEFFCNDGSPIGIVPGDVFGQRGVGGAELALLSLTETLAAMGHEVRVYNNPRTEPEDTRVKFMAHAAFNRLPRADVFVLFRAPNVALLRTTATRKLFWSCDQYTTGNYTTEIFPLVDQIVTISPYHTQYHIGRWKADPKKINHIDLGVRLQDYATPVEKLKGHAIYCSMPARGLTHLAKVWPRIVKQVPEARLSITGDVTLWGARATRLQRWRLKFARLPGVDFLGKVPRAQLIQLQLQAMVHIFPCVYDELFCISVGECQAAGAVPITTECGALDTTNRWGYKIPGDPSTKPWRKRCVELAIEGLSGGLQEARAAGIAGARQDFDWEKIAGQWVHLAETGEFPSSKERGGSA